MFHEKESPATLAGAHRAKGDLWRINGGDDSDMRADAQRRLAYRLASGAGLSVALASLLVAVALGDGGQA